MTVPSGPTAVPDAERCSTEGVHYTVTGDGERTVVLLHGFSDNLTTWSRIIAPMAVGHRVVAVDLPGFGRSTRAWSSDGLCAGYVSAVRDVLDAEGIDGPVSFVGNSMGAVVATLFAAAHPGRTAAVVLIDMPGLRSVPRLWQLAMSRPAELGLRTALRVVPGAVAQAGLGLAYTRVAAARPGRLEPDVRQAFCGPYAARASVAGLLPIGRALLRDLAGADLGRVVMALEVPSLLVFGSRDVLTPARVLRRIGRASGAVVLPGCGHCPQIDQPAALLAEVLPFLRAAGERTVQAEVARSA